LYALYCAHSSSNPHKSETNRAVLDIFYGVTTDLVKGWWQAEISAHGDKRSQEHVSAFMAYIETLLSPAEPTIARIMQNTAAMVADPSAALKSRFNKAAGKPKTGSTGGTKPRQPQGNVHVTDEEMAKLLARLEGRQCIFCAQSYDRDHKCAVAPSQEERQKASVVRSKWSAARTASTGTAIAAAAPAPHVQTTTTFPKQSKRKGGSGGAAPTTVNLLAGGGATDALEQMATGYLAKGSNLTATPLSCLWDTGNFSGRAPALAGTSALVPKQVLTDNLDCFEEVRWCNPTIGLVLANGQTSDMEVVAFARCTLSFWFRGPELRSTLEMVAICQQTLPMPHVIMQESFVMKRLYWPIIRPPTGGVRVSISTHMRCATSSRTYLLRTTLTITQSLLWQNWPCELKENEQHGREKFKGKCRILTCISCRQGFSCGNC